jgi:hypothetical protein
MSYNEGSDKAKKKEDGRTEVSREIRCPVG